MRVLVGPFSMDIPNTWNDRTVYTFVAPKVVNPRESPHLRMGSGFRENIVVTRERVRRDINPQDYLRQQLDDLKDRLQAFRLLREEPLRVGGYLAHSASYQFGLRGERLDICQFRVVLLVDDDAVTFTGTAAASVFEAKKRVFLNILNTLELPLPG